MKKLDIQKKLDELRAQWKTASPEKRKILEVQAKLLKKAL